MKEKIEEKNKNIDFKTLNELIKNGNLILKIALAMLVLTIGVLGIYLIDKTSILPTIGNILSILSPLFIGIALAWLLEPMIEYFVKNKVGRKLATVVVYLIFLFLIFLIMALILPEFVSQLNELIKKIPDYLKAINDFINNIFANFASSEMDLSEMKDNLVKNINNFVNSLTSEDLTGLVSTLGSSVRMMMNICLGVLIGFYLSLDFSKLGKNLGFLIPTKYKGEVNKVKKSLNEMLRSYVSGTLISCVFVMILSLIGFLISGVSSPLLFAVFCAITNLIPYFGPYIGGIPVIIVGFAISPFTGIICLITVLIVQFLEGNILHPLIVGKAISLHPITMMLSLLVFQHFFGILGMLLAAPIVATLKIICLYLNEKYNFLSKIR